MPVASFSFNGGTQNKAISKLLLEKHVTIGRKGGIARQRKKGRRKTEAKNKR